MMGWTAEAETRRWPSDSGGNGHFYEAIVVAGGITWHAANERAISRGGYLATISSADENVFVFSLVQDDSYWRNVSGFWYGPWLGGWQPAGSTEASGGWRWVNEEPFSYRSWGRGEPNNNGNEDRLHHGGSRTSPAWNDLDGSWTDLVRAYIVEYETEPSPQPTSGILYSEDFESAVGSEWSPRTASRSPRGSRGFLGRFGNQTVTLSLTDLPPHTNLVVALDLFILDTWDGNSNPGPDVFEVQRGEDGALLLHTTFSHSRLAARHQAFPENHPQGRHHAHTGASEINTIGYDRGDAVYPLRFEFPHVGDTLVLRFQASGLQALGDESWGIDNVRVATGNPPTVTMTSPQNEAAFGFPTKISIAADVQDNDSDLVRVDFFANGRLLTSATKPPFELVWEDAPPGVIPISVRATDARGLTGVAAAIVKINGLKGEYFDNTDLTNPRVTQQDPQVNFTWENRLPVPAGISDIYYSVRWTGYIEPEFTQDYNLSMVIDDGGRLWVDGRRVIDAWRGQSATRYPATVPLEKGRRSFIQVEYNNTGCCGSVVRLGWQSPSQPEEIIPQSRLFPPEEGANRPPNIPVIVEPRQDGQWVDPRALEVAADFFSDPNTGDSHTASDWEIWTVDPPERVWSAMGSVGSNRLRIRLSHGTFSGSHENLGRLQGGLAFSLRTRHRDSSSDARTDWSEWAVRQFYTIPEALMSQSDLVSMRVPGTSNPWLAGMPDGARAGTRDTAPAQSPVFVSEIALDTGSALMFLPSGSVRHGPSGAETGPEGGSNATHQYGTEHNLSSLTAPINSLVGVFLGPDRPGTSPAPPGLDFGTPTNRDYSTLNPELKQVFFIGNGRTSDGTIQSVFVPSSATRLFLGTMDTQGWYNNTGYFDVTIVPTVSVTQASILSNGSFENPGFASDPGYIFLDNGDTRITGWTVIDDGVGDPPYWNRYDYRPDRVVDGNYSIILNQGSGVRTTLEVEQSAIYEVSFFLKAIIQSNQVLTPLEVRFGDDSRSIERIATWVRHYLRFTSPTTSKEYPLEFYNPSVTGDYRPYTLDGIAVVRLPPTPPPLRLTMTRPGEFLIEGTPGRQYQLETTDSLNTPILWRSFIRFDLSTPLLRVSVPMPVGQDASFFRLLEEP